MEIDQIKTNQSESPDILELSVDKPTEQIEGTPEETVKTVSSGDENNCEDHPIAKPTNAHTDNNATKTSADETTDQEILKRIMPSDSRRRRGLEKGPLPHH